MSKDISNMNVNNTPLGAGGFAEIIIPLALPKNYTWSVPESLKDSVHVGCRVEVNLGKNKKYANKKPRTGVRGFLRGHYYAR